MNNFRNLVIQALVVILILSAFSIDGNAQDQELQGSKFGISAALQTEQLDLLFPIWTSNSFVVVPSVSLAYASDVATDIGFGMALRYNLLKGDAVPYLGGRAGMFILSPNVGNSINDYVFGPFVGGEYFIDKHFSFSVEAQLNITKSDKNSLRFGNPDGTNFNTATLAMASFYF